MKILITNDDGIFSKGIEELAKVASEFGKVTIVAPDIERSAAGHAITISTLLRVTEVEKDGKFFGHAISGTPADCVKIACSQILDSKPDLILSGINNGSNTAQSVIYSGTVSAASEGTMNGIKSIATSIDSWKPKTYELAKNFLRKLIPEVLENGLPQGTLLNVNVPNVLQKDCDGIVVAKQGKARYVEYFEKRSDPTGRTYYWLGGKKMNLDTEPDVDDVAVMNNKIAITPIQYELTNNKFLADLEKWQLSY
ncbi:MAG: 5'/3'-nucleotidase SurE [Calditrichaeota bacterium]|nr:MAG: 5'/3'-nucleotidase SurE [Calditrichota bacterium]